MLSEEAMDALKNIGLNLYERKLYAALLARGSATVGELSDMANVPRSRAYDVLESLAEKGFVVIQNTKPMRYVVVPPREAVERAKKKMREDLEASLSRLDRLAASTHIEELEKLYSEGLNLVNPAEFSGALKGQPMIDLHLSTMFREASESIDIMATPTAVEKLWKTHGDLLKKAAQEGIRIRILAPLSQVDKQTLEELSRIAEVRDTEKASSLPTGRMIIVDHDQVLMGLTPDHETHASQDIAFWTHSDHFSGNFARRVFDLAWKKAGSP